MLETLNTIAGAVNEANWILVNQQLQQLLDKTVEEDELEQAAAIAIQVMKAGDFQTRWDVAKIFPKIGKKSILPLLEILEDEEAEVEIRWFALRILGNFNEPQVVISLVRLVEETEEDELAAASAQALAQIGKTALTAMTKLLKNEKSKLLAVKSLAQIRRSEIIDILLDVIDDSEPEIRAIAIEALGSFHQKRLIPIFITALKDISAQVRKEAIIALKMRGEFKEEFDLVNHLQPLLYDINLEVCQQAVLTLGYMRDETAIKALFDFLNFKNTSLSLKQEAVRALNWSTNISALNYLKYFLHSKEIALHEEIIAVLGRQESIEFKSYATQILIDFLNTELETNHQSHIKQAIATSLGELGDSSALIYLEKLTFDDNSKVKLYAKAAIKKITQSQVERNRNQV